MKFAKPDLSKLKGIKHKKQIVIIAIVVICALIIGIVFYSNVVSKSSNYDEAVSMYNESNYKDAEEKFKNLGDYKDSKEYADKSYEKIMQNKYNNAVSLMDRGLYADAMSIFREISEYKDSSILAERCETYYISGAPEEASARTDSPENVAYYKIAKEYREKYGVGYTMREKREGVESYTVTGVCLLMLTDFDGNGTNELVIGTKEDKNKHKANYAIYTYDKGTDAVKLIDGKYTSHEGENGYCSFEVLSDNNSKLLYFGDYKSGSTMLYNGLKFLEKDSWSVTGKGKKAKYALNDKYVKKDEYNKAVPSYDAGEILGEGTKPVKTYRQTKGSFVIYLADYLSVDAANDLADTNQRIYDILEASYNQKNS